MHSNSSVIGPNVDFLPIGKVGNGNSKPIYESQSVICGMGFNRFINTKGLRTKNIEDALFIFKSAKLHLAMCLLFSALFTTTKK